ncbi:hypothetical protein MCEMIHM21_01184 [Candidatus Pelagibacterales bacterium]
MKKIILIIFLSFFISSSSYSSPVIELASPLKENQRLVYRCKNIKDNKTQIFARNYNNLNNPLIIELYDNDTNKIRVISLLFKNDSAKEYIFYDNKAGLIISKYILSGSIVKPTFKVQSIAGGDEKSLTLYNDLTKILKLDNSTKFLKEIKKYSVALKDHYEDVTKKKYTIKITEENLNCEETKKYELN